MPIQLVSNPERGFVALILPDPGRRKLRFLFSHDGGLRALAWMNVGADGSLYLNHRIDAPNAASDGEGVADGKGGFAEVEWRELSLTEDEMRKRKLSQHASGVVKSGDKRSWSVNVRDVAESTLVRQDEYAHPSRFEAIPAAALRSTDLVVPGQDGAPYEIQEDRPLTSRVFVAPLNDGAAQVPIIDDDPAADTQTAIVVPYTNLRGCQSLTYQIQFFNRAPGAAWPDRSIVAVLNTEMRDEAADG